MPEAVGPATKTSKKKKTKKKKKKKKKKKVDHHRFVFRSHTFGREPLQHYPQDC